jgi:hypothetical protein
MMELGRVDVVGGVVGIRLVTGVGRLRRWLRQDLLTDWMRVLCEISKSDGRREGGEEAEESNPSEASGLAWLSMESSVAVVRELDN